MDRAKVQLSAEEMALVRDPAWILTKNSILAKAMGLFAALSEEYKTLWKEMMWKETMWKEDGMGADGEGMNERMNVKISKGENYGGLPYVMLDYPRIFGKQDVLAIRTMFWWGHYFSVTLHLKGRYQTLYMPVIREQLSALGAAGFHIGVSEDEWRHELDQDNYRRIDEAGGLDGAGGGNREIEKILGEHPFLKLSAHFPLDQWDEAPAILLRLYRVLTALLGSRFPADPPGC